MAEDEYEALPSSKMTTHMLAGAAAGVMEHTIMYPVDCVKTRMQCLNPNPKANYRNVADALYRIIRYEGLANSMRGINAVVSGAGPAHALYFACYEKMKRVLSSSPQGTHLSRGLAGVFATLLHDAVMNPAEVVKQRMQVYDSPYKTCTECLQDVLRREGMVAFYRSYTTQLSMNIPFQSIHFMVYEFFQDMLNMERQYKPSTHVISGAMAGAFAAAATTPLDVCKTLLNTQERCAVTKSGSTITGLTQAFRTVYQFQGFKGYFRGVSARVIHQMPGTAISWSVYEFFKFFITKRQQASCDGFVSPASVAAVQLHSVSSEDDITP